MEAILFYLAGLLGLFIVIQLAVTKAINNSIIGEMFEKKYGKGISELLEKEYGQTEDEDKN